MSLLKKAILLQLWFFIGFPLLLVALFVTLRWLGAFIFLCLFVIWIWEVYAFIHYRHCRQEEFLHVLQTAAATQAPVESVLRAYLRDRPHEHLYRAMLLFFVFPGYYWVHMQRSFDQRIARLVAMLDSGLPLDQALYFVPGVVSRDVALAISVGNYSGKLTHSLNRLPDRRLASQSLELGLRLLYPLLILTVLLFNVAFLVLFVIPKYQKILLDFKLKMPPATEVLIVSSQWAFQYAWVMPTLWLSLLVMGNILLFSSRAKWYCPLVNWVYRLNARGQFLRTLGLMLETGKPLPEIMGHVLASGLLPGAVASRVARLAADLSQGEPLAASLGRHGLVTASMQGLIASAEKAQNLPWALQELGESLTRRSVRLLHRITMVLFPLIIFAIACLVAFVVVSLFSPLVTMLEGIHG